MSEVSTSVTGAPEGVGPAGRRTVVYAVTHLDYDQVFSPVAKTPGVDFVLFADRRPRLVRGWQWRPLPGAVAGMSQTLANRYAKFFPWAVLPEAGCSIYLDANTLVLGDLSPLVAEFLASGADIGLFPHRERSTLAEEFEFGRQVGKIPPEDVEKGLAQLRRYREAGLPPDPPFTENAIIFRRHGNPALEAAMQLWWSELMSYTQRDQLSLPYVLHVSGLRLKLWDWNYKYVNPYFMRYPHRRGALADFNVLLKNKQQYGPLQHALYGGLLFLLHGGRTPRPHHRSG